jgi:hypothetical protein
VFATTQDTEDMASAVTGLLSPCQTGMKHLYTLVSELVGTRAVHQVRAATLAEALDQWCQVLALRNDFREYNLTDDDLTVLRHQLGERLRPLDQPCESCWFGASDFGQDFRYLDWPTDKIPNGVKPVKIRGALALLIIDTRPADPKGAA